jgi:hypothetical protein
LENKVDEMKNSIKPYDSALLAYALMLSKSPKADAAFLILSGQARFEGIYVLKMSIKQCYAIGFVICHTDDFTLSFL